LGCALQTGISPKRNLVRTPALRGGFPVLNSRINERNPSLQHGINCFKLASFIFKSSYVTPSSRSVLMVTNLRFSASSSCDESKFVALLDLAYSVLCSMFLNTSVLCNELCGRFFANFIYSFDNVRCTPQSCKISINCCLVIEYRTPYRILLGNNFHIVSTFAG
jgi:hypothetical protein